MPRRRKSKHRDREPEPPSPWVVDLDNPDKPETSLVLPPRPELPAERLETSHVQAVIRTNIVLAAENMTPIMARLLIRSKRLDPGDLQSVTRSLQSLSQFLTNMRALEKTYDKPPPPPPAPSAGQLAASLAGEPEPQPEPKPETPEQPSKEPNEQG